MNYLTILSIGFFFLKSNKISTLIRRVLNSKKKGGKVNFLIVILKVRYATMSYLSSYFRRKKWHTRHL